MTKEVIVSIQEPKCPACGSEKVQKSMTKREVCVPYALPTSVDVSVYRCESCGESGDFGRENDAKYLAVEDAAKKTSVQSMLADLNENGVSMAYFERAMQLPTRTIARWKEGNFSASAVALLRVVRTFPWILPVAESGFKESVYQSVLIQEAGRVVHQVVAPNIESGAIWVSFNDEKTEINARVILNMPFPTPIQPTRYVSGG